MFTIKNLNFLLTQRPSACAQIVGNNSYPDLLGTAYFYKVSNGIILISEVKGLPIGAPQPCNSFFFGLDIHEGSECTGNDEEPFGKAGMLYNPQHCAFPNDAGQLPPLLENNGEAFMAILISKFTIEEIIGRTIIIHAPSNSICTESETKIACGRILSTGCNTQP